MHGAVDHAGTESGAGTEPGAGPRTADSTIAPPADPEGARCATPRAAGLAPHTSRLLALSSRICSRLCALRASLASSARARARSSSLRLIGSASYFWRSVAFASEAPAALLPTHAREGSDGGFGRLLREPMPSGLRAVPPDATRAGAVGAATLVQWRAQCPSRPHLWQRPVSPAAAAALAAASMSSAVSSGRTRGVALVATPAAALDQLPAPSPAPAPSPPPTARFGAAGIKQ